MHYDGPHIWSGIILEGAAEMMLKGYGVGNNIAGLLSAVAAGGVRARHGLAPQRCVGDGEAGAAAGRVHAPALPQPLSLQGAEPAGRCCATPTTQALEEVDMLAMPTIPFTATPIPEPDCAREIYVDRALNMQANTCPFDVSGHPAFTIPCGMKDGLPVGLMLVGRHFEESRLIQAASAFEDEETMSNDLHYLDLVDVGAPHQGWRALAGGADRGHAAAHRQARRRAEELRHRHRRSRAEAGPRGGCRDQARRLARAAARRADRREGPLLHQGHSDRGRHGDPQGFQARPRCDGRRRASPRPAPSCWASCSSPRAPSPTTTPRSRRRSIPGTRTTGRALRRADRAWRPRPASASPRSAPIPAVRSASRPPPTA